MVTEAIQTMIELSTQVEMSKTVKAMKKLVPEFISKNSPYEEIDIKVEKSLV